MSKLTLVSKLTLTVEVTAGTDIRKAVREMCDLAIRTGVLIEANFNGVKVWATQNTDPDKLINEYHSQLCRKSELKIAHAIRNEDE